METKTKSFAGAMKDFFDFLPRQSLSEFGAELKALNDQDRAYFRAGLEQNGYTITG